MQKDIEPVRKRRPFPRFDDLVDNFVTDIERNMFDTWSLPGLRFPDFWNIEKAYRLPASDLEDKGDKYELTLEIPGIKKDKIDVKATKNSLEVSGVQEEKSEEKSKNYVYNERTRRSFHRKIAIPEEIIPSQISAEMKDGVLEVTIPKKTPTKVEGTTKVEVK
jgi:HSP20 family protein